ncbi:hypothetical protein [Pseudomonas sp. FW306-2-2C-D06C]
MSIVGPRPVQGMNSRCTRARRARTYRADPELRACGR